MFPFVIPLTFLGSTEAGAWNLSAEDELPNSSAEDELLNSSAEDELLKRELGSRLYLD